MPKSLPHNQAQLIHAKKRATERFGVSLTKEDLRWMVFQIQSRKAEFKGKYSLTKSLFIVTVNGVKVPVIYDKQRQQIATILPENAKELTQPVEIRE